MGHRRERQKTVWFVRESVKSVENSELQVGRSRQEIEKIEENRRTREGGRFCSITVKP